MSRKRLFLVVLVSVLLGTGIFTYSTVNTPGAAAKSLDELREELRSKREQLKDTEGEIKKFQAEIQEKKRDARTLEDQIGLLDQSIGEVELNLERTLLEIEKTDLEIEEVEAEIEEREAEMNIQKKRLAGLIRTLHALDQQSTVTILLKYQTFAEAVDDAATVEELQKRGHETLLTIKRLREELANKRRDLEDFRLTLDELKTRQEKEQKTLATQRGSKERILDLTNQQEAQYQQLLKQAQASHVAAEGAISALDTAIREELAKQGVDSLGSVGILDWPIYPEFGVSCEFHCSGYPYEYLIGKHSAIDIPANVGTPVKAPADGYVAKVHDSGGPGYSYLLLIHGDGVSTVYGHLSGFNVNEDEIVARGTIIGYTGGAAGMRGAGLSTGPHLHFEVRENNIPVNPRNYLN